jgi:hypothetical protein
MQNFKKLAVTLLTITLGLAQAKTIAVTDLSYKKEVSEFFYFEAASARSSESGASSYKASGHDRSTRDYAAATSASATAAGGRNYGYANANVQSNVAARQRNDKAFQAQSNSVYANKSESSYVKTFGDKIRVQYSELMGMSGDVRGALIKAGYKLMQARPSLAQNGETDQFFDVVGKFKSGQYSGAQYVLYGVLAAMEATGNREPIQGTNNFMYKSELNLTVDYSLIDTETMQAVAAFTVMATGDDNRIDSAQSTFRPSSAKMMKTAASELSEEVQKQLYAQGFLKNLTVQPQAGAGMPQSTYRDDPSTLKVYK